MRIIQKVSGTQGHVPTQDSPAFTSMLIAIATQIIISDLSFLNIFKTCIKIISTRAKALKKV